MSMMALINMLQQDGISIKLSLLKNEISLNYLTEDISYYASLNASFNVQDGCPGESFGFTYSDIIKSQSTIKSLRPMLKEIAYNDTQILLHTISLDMIFSQILQIIF